MLTQNLQLYNRLNGHLYLMEVAVKGLEGGWVSTDLITNVLGKYYSEDGSRQ